MSPLIAPRNGATQQPHLLFSAGSWLTFERRTARPVRKGHMLRAVQPTVRFGLMYSGTTLPAWGARCLETLVARDGVEMALLIVEDGAADAERPADLLWRLYWRLVVNRRSQSLRPAGLPAAPEAVPVAAPADIAAIRGHGLDFILRLSSGDLSGDILTAARYGVWSFAHGNEQRCGEGVS